MPRITIATHEFYPRKGGIATFSEELAAAFVRGGDAVTVLAPKASRNPLSEDGFDLEPLSFPADHGWRATFGMARELARRQGEFQQGILCVTEPGPLWALRLAARFYGFRAPRLWVVVHGSEIVRGLHSRSWRRTLDFAFNRAERIATVSAYNREILVEGYRLAPERLVVLPVGPPERIKRAARNFERIQQGEADRLVLLTVGRLHPRKGQDLILKGLARLDPELLARLEYRVVGGGRTSYEKRLRRMASSGRLPVTFPGPLGETSLLDEYAGADVFALTSREHKHSREGFGLVYLEAGCFGIPVLGARSGGVGDAVRHEETGLLVPEANVEAIAAALDRLLRDFTLRKRLGAAGRAVALGRSWDAVASKLREG